MLDPDTRDWTDGLLSHIFREVNRPLVVNRVENKFIVFDGDVDAVGNLYHSFMIGFDLRSGSRT